MTVFSWHKFLAFINQNKNRNTATLGVWGWQLSLFIAPQCRPHTLSEFATPKTFCFFLPASRQAGLQKEEEDNIFMAGKS